MYVKLVLAIFKKAPELFVKGQVWCYYKGWQGTISLLSQQ